MINPQQQFKIKIAELERELQFKNRELEIEASLEKVRTIAMGMREPADMLDVCKTISLQLQSLGVKEIRNVQTAIFYEQRGTYMNYEFYAKHDKTFITETVFTNNEIHNEFAKKMMRGGGETFITHIKDYEVKEWIEYQKTTNVFIDKYLETASSLNYYWFSLGPVALGISTYIPLAEDEINLFKRFLKVFELAYQRYLDIEIAEAQAREAQIELALERVRARTMAMQKSEELKDVIRVVFEQFVHLKINVDHAGFVVDYTPKGDWHFWIADEQDIPSKITHPYFESVWANQFNEAKEKGIDFFATNLNFEEKNKFYNELLSYVPGLSEASKHFYLGCPGLAATTVLFDNVSLYIENFSGTPYSDEENKILMRFGKVFQQTYTRFLDLQKSEAQAREAQIEAALERVRSRSMAMYNTADLGAVVFEMFSGLLKLDAQLDRCIIMIVDSQTLGINWYLSGKEGLLSNNGFLVQNNPHPSHQAYLDGWRKKRKKWHYLLAEEEKKSWDAFGFAQTGLAQLPDFIKADMSAVESIHLTISSDDFGCLIASSLSPLSEAHASIVDRFTTVFNQTYTRFLDLQKSEAQAREAQIEAALERVRSKAMAMNSPEDLAITVDTFFSELNKLDIVPHRCGVGIVDPETRIADIRATAFTKENVSKKIVGKLKLAGHPVLDKIFENWGLRQEYHPVLKGNEISEYYKVMNSQVTFPDFADDEIQYGHYFHFKEGGVFAWTDKELKEEDLQIFRRYTSVLSLTYRRYAELKEAEAQAREAKIEASLERVRSKAMAMHSPNDLSETVNIFFKELKTLGITPIRCGVGQIDEATRTTSLTTTTASQQGESFQVIGKVKQTGHRVLDGIFDHWKIQKEYHPVLQGEDIKAYYKVMNRQIGYPHYPEGVTQYGNSFPFKEGFIFAWTENLLTDEELRIFRRFTTVLSLTYRRYLDLKEAEERNKIIQAENDRKTKELEEARQLQLSLLPKTVPELPHLDIAVYMKTATEVGGDYYDFNIQDDGVLNIGFGDATGHGLQAGTMITLMKGFFTSDVGRFSPQKFLQHCNGMIRNIKLGRILMSFCHLRFENRRLLISSAGMPPIYFHNKKNNRTEEIIVQGLPLGAMGSASYKLVDKELNHGDTILLLTDGLPEQMNSHKVIFDYSRVLKYFDEIAENTPDEIINRLVHIADEWMDGQQQNDDITFVVIKVL